MRRCWGLTRNLHRCRRTGQWGFFCDEHRRQPFIWLSFVVFTVLGSIASMQSAWWQTRQPSLSDPEFAYNMARVRLEIRLENVHFNLQRELYLHTTVGSLSSEHLSNDLSLFYREVAAVKDVLRHLSPPKDYLNSNKDLEESLERYANAIFLTRDAITQHQDNIPHGTQQEIDAALEGILGSKQSRSVLFSSHYSKLESDLAIHARASYEGSDFENAIYYHELGLQMYSLQKNTGKAAEATYQLALAYRKIAQQTDRYALIKDVARDDFKLAVKKDIWLQGYSQTRSRLLLEQSLLHLKKVGNEHMISTVLTILGSMYDSIFNEPDKAIAYYLEAIPILQKSDLKKYFKVTNAIGAIYCKRARNEQQSGRRDHLSREAHRLFSNARDILGAWDSGAPDYSMASFMVQHNRELAETGCQGPPIYDSFY